MVLHQYLLPIPPVEAFIPQPDPLLDRCCYSAEIEFLFSHSFMVSCTAENKNHECKYALYYCHIATPNSGKIVRSDFANTTDAVCVWRSVIIVHCPFMRF